MAVFASIGTVVGAQLLGGTAMAGYSPANNAQTWVDWNTNYSQITTNYSQITNGMTVNAQTWVDWNTNYSQITTNYSQITNGMTVNQATWNQWNTQGFLRRPTSVIHYEQPRPTDEEMRAMTEAAAKATREHAAAIARAEALLLEHLDPRQRESYTANKLFIVETPRKNRYRLRHSGQPVKLEGEKEVVRYCIHTYGVPREDELLGFKLLLEANEDEFLKTANATRLAA